MWTVAEGESCREQKENKVFKDKGVKWKDKAE